MVGVSRSSYYAWAKRPATLISADELNLYRRAKALFNTSRQSLGSRELMKKLREEGFTIGRHRTKTLMRKLDLKVTQRLAYKVTTKRKHSDRVADNLLNQNFNPVGPNQVWAGDITYLKTGEGWIYLAIVMDLYSRRIIGWEIHKRMTTELVERALIVHDDDFQVTIFTDSKLGSIDHFQTWLSMHKNMLLLLIDNIN
jgi:putative transposase